MKKIIICALCIIFISGCSADADSIFTDNELSILDAYGLAEKAQNDCSNQTTVKKMLMNDFKKSNFETYCELDVDNVDGLNELISNNVSNEDIKKYESVSYFDSDKISRYLSYDAKTVKERILSVNMNKDLEPFSDNATVLTSIDKKTLINQYYRISKIYEPEDLKSIDTVCDGPICHDAYVNSETAKAFKKMTKAAKDENIDIYAVYGYMTLEEQDQYYLMLSLTKGLKYAQKNAAVSGFSDLGSGYGLIIGINNLSENKVAESDEYQWLKENMHKYGFIVRYDKGKEDETGYDYNPLQLRYVGLDLAEKLYKNDMSMEYYYATK